MLRGSKEITGLPVVSIEEGEEIGKVRMLIPDPHKPEIIGVVIEDKEWFRGAKIVTFEKIFGIGESAVTVVNKEQLSKVDSFPEVEDVLLRGITLLGSRVLTKKGEFLGRVDEFYIEMDGKIVAYEIDMENDVKFLPSEEVLTVGKGIIIAKEDAKERLLTSLGNPEEARIKTSLESNNKNNNINIQKVEIELEKSKENKLKETKDEGPTPEEKNLLIASAKKEVDLKKIFQERQRKYLMGKKVIKDIFARNGEILVTKDTVIDEEVLDKVQKEGKFLELSMSVDISG